VGPSKETPRLPRVWNPEPSTATQKKKKGKKKKKTGKKKKKTLPSARPHDRQESPGQGMTAHVLQNQSLPAGRNWPNRVFWGGEEGLVVAGCVWGTSRVDNSRACRQACEGTEQQTYFRKSIHNQTNTAPLGNLNYSACGWCSCLRWALGTPTT